MTANVNNSPQNGYMTEIYRIKKPRQSISTDYDNNMDFQKTCTRICAKVLTQYATNNLSVTDEKTNLIILHLNDLRDIISSMKAVSVNDVNIITSEIIITKCCKSEILPYKDIISITVKKQNLSATDRHIISGIYHFSLDYIYDDEEDTNTITETTVSLETTNDITKSEDIIDL